MTTEAIQLIDHASQWQQDLAKGTYKSQREIAKVFEISHTMVSYALKTTRWPNSVIELIKRHSHQISRSDIIRAGRLESQDPHSLNHFFHSIIKREEQPMTTQPIHLVTSKTGHHDDPRNPPANPVNTTVLQGFTLNLLILSITALGAWLTRNLYSDISEDLRYFIAFAVLFVIGVVLPSMAHQLPKQQKLFAWCALGAGLFYSVSLVLFGNLQLTKHKQIKADQANQKIIFIQDKIKLNQEQQKQWQQGYLDPTHKNYHKSHAKRKAEQLGEKTQLLQGKIAALQIQANSVDWGMLFVDILRQLVVEIALVLVVLHRGRRG